MPGASRDEEPTYLMKKLSIWFKWGSLTWRATPLSMVENSSLWVSNSPRSARRRMSRTESAAPSRYVRSANFQSVLECSRNEK